MTAYSAQQFLFGHDKLPPWRKAFARAAMLGLIGLYCCLPILEDMIMIWLTSANYGHGALALPMALAVGIAQHRTMGRHPDQKISPHVTPWAAIPFTLSLGGALWCHEQGYGLPAHLCVYAMLVSSFVLFAGWRATLSQLPALLLALFMVPFGESALPLLRWASALFADLLLNLTMLPISREGLMFETDIASFHVADGCAGLGMVGACLMIAISVGTIKFKQPAQVLRLSLLAIGIALLTNAVRIALIIGLAVASNGNWRGFEDHFTLGLAIDAAGIFALLLIAAFWARRQS